MRTSELTSAALDWAVAKCEGALRVEYYGRRMQQYDDVDGKWYDYNPSSDWAQGGPIIERERIHIAPQHPSKGGWMAIYEKDDTEYPYRFGFVSPTPLIAAMRCYVASKLGDTIEVPEELK